MIGETGLSLEVDSGWRCQNGASAAPSYRLSQEGVLAVRAAREALAQLDFSVQLESGRADGSTLTVWQGPQELLTLSIADDGAQHHRLYFGVVAGLNPLRFCIRCGEGRPVSAILSFNFNRLRRLSD